MGCLCRTLREEYLPRQGVLPQWTPLTLKTAPVRVPETRPSPVRAGYRFAPTHGFALPIGRDFALAGYADQRAIIMEHHGGLFDKD